MTRSCAWCHRDRCFVRHRSSAGDQAVRRRLSRRPCGAPCPISSTELARQLPIPAVVKTIDVSQPDTAIPLLQSLIDELGDVEVFIVSAGVGFENYSLAWAPERDTIAVNVVGFTAMVNVAAAHLAARGSGHLVGISSLAAHRQSRGARLLGVEGVRVQLSRWHALDSASGPVDRRHRHRAGFVDTAMAKSPAVLGRLAGKAADQILACAPPRATRICLRRWRLVLAAQGSSGSNPARPCAELYVTSARTPFALRRVRIQRRADQTRGHRHDRRAARAPFEADAQRG
jgi:NAD(P)-dependent dehydrogenase (short-subunit alcohol dehydrogenase family)